MYVPSCESRSIRTVFPCSSSSSCRLRAMFPVSFDARSVMPIVRAIFTYVQRYSWSTLTSETRRTNMATSENFDLAHLGGIELFTPKFEESLHFFRDICAMREVARIGDSSYLRCWDEYQLYTLKLTASDTNGVGRTLYRAASPAARDRRVAASEAAGLGHGWRDPEVGVGRSYEFEDPD